MNKSFKLVQFEAKGDGYLLFLFGESEDGAWALGDGNYYGMIFGAGDNNDQFRIFHDGVTQVSEAVTTWAHRLTEYKFTSYRIKLEINHLKSY